MKKPDMPVRDAFVKAAKEMYGDLKTITRFQIGEVQERYNLPRPHWLMIDRKFRSGRGEYYLRTLPDGANANGAMIGVRALAVPMVQVIPQGNVTEVIDQPPVMEQMASTIVNFQGTSLTMASYVPEKAIGYVPFGHYNDIRAIIKAGLFYPIYITRESGNGKTMMVEQIHAELKKEYIRANITNETDEDDLLGGFRLIDGHTVWQNGPVIMAMERGCTILLDEVDLGTNKLMCLQPVLEGKAVYFKKINKIVQPKPGFNVIATANTKGKGSDDGRFIGTNVLNEAFLERFSITFEQVFPPIKTEIRILNYVLQKGNAKNEKFSETLVNWADIIRKTFAEGACNDLISTRRLVNICEGYIIFGTQMKAINLCLNRFDQETKKTFLELYDKLEDNEADKTLGPTVPADAEPANLNEDIPF